MEFFTCVKPLQTELNEKNFWKCGKKDLVNCKTWHRESRAHTHQSTALQCSVKTNKAIFKETLKKKGSSNKNGRVTRQEHKSAAHWEVSLVYHSHSEIPGNSQCPAARPMKECQPSGKGKTPKKSIYPSVWKSELSSEATSSLSLPLSSDFIQMSLSFQKKNPREYK